MRGLHRLVRRLRPVPRGEYANDGFPREHPRPPRGTGSRGVRRSRRGS
ncbi:hypothetical protein [Streptomyces radicis]|nr:hypothetical protein [Streptomyces radicis]